jgi:hypothetical protein
MRFDTAKFDVRRYDPPLDDLIARLREIKGPAIVGIDGRMSAGKSWLGQWLAIQLGWGYCELDNELPGDGSWHQPGVVRAKVCELRQAGQSALVEGARLLDGVSPEELDFLVFVEFHPPCTPTGRLQKGIETYLKSRRPSERADFMIRAA